MRHLTALVISAGIVFIAGACMWFQLYTRVSEIAEHQVRIIGLLQTEPSERAKLMAALNDHRE